jgi:hypothetical protein
MVISDHHPQRLAFHNTGSANALSSNVFRQLLWLDYNHTV